MVDCHPLSSQAIASTSSGRSVMAGPPMFGQTAFPAAAISAACTSAFGASVPVWLGQVAPADGEAVTGGAAGCGGGGAAGGGTAARVGAGLAVGFLVGVAALRLGLGDGEGDGLADGEALGDGDAAWLAASVAAATHSPGSATPDRLCPHPTSAATATSVTTVTTALTATTRPLPSETIGI